MSERFHILTPCARPQNIARIWESIQASEPHPFEVRWHIAAQGPEPDPFGINKTNELLDGACDGWVLTFADDSLIHPSLMRRVGEIAAQQPHAGAIIVTQQRRDYLGVLRACPENMEIGRVSGDQIVWRREFLGDSRFDYAKHAHCCDGALICERYQAAPERFVFVDEVLSWFNRLA